MCEEVLRSPSKSFFNFSDNISAAQAEEIKERNFNSESAARTYTSQFWLKWPAVLMYSQSV